MPIYNVIERGNGFQTVVTVATLDEAKALAHKSVSADPTCVGYDRASAALAIESTIDTLELFTNDGTCIAIEPTTYADVLAELNQLREIVAER